MILSKSGNPINSTLADLQNDIATRELAEAMVTAAELMPHPSRVLRTISRSITEFEKTLMQPDVAAASLNIHDGIKALKWDVSQSKTEGPRAEWFKSLFKTWKDLPATNSGAVTSREFGYTIFEVEWAKDGRTIIPVSAIEKPREWFRYDNAGRLRLITKERNNEGILVDEVYPRKFIAIRHRHTYKNPYGVGLLELVYWIVQGINRNFEWLLEFLEDSGTDPWIAYVSQDANQDYINKVQKALSILRRRSVAVLFEGVRAEQRENRGRKSSSDAFTAFDSLAVTKINKLWLGTDLSMQLGSVGSRASSKTGADIRDEAIMSCKSLPEELMNTIIRWTTELNTLPGSAQEEILYVLSKPSKTTKEQAEIDQIYALATGRKIGPALLARRGYEPNDFVASNPDGIGQTFSASITGERSFSPTAESGYSDLAPLFNAVEGLKKKP